jgi:hypothetical protein
MDDQSKALSSRGIVDSGTMRSLVRAQEATGKAHVTIQVTPLVKNCNLIICFIVHDIIFELTYAMVDTIMYHNNHIKSYHIAS